MPSAGRSSLTRPNTSNQSRKHGVRLLARPPSCAVSPVPRPAAPHTPHYITPRLLPPSHPSPISGLAMQAVLHSATYSYLYTRIREQQELCSLPPTFASVHAFGSSSVTLAHMLAYARASAHAYAQGSLIIGTSGHDHALAEKGGVGCIALRCNAMQCIAPPTRMYRATRYVSPPALASASVPAPQNESQPEPMPVTA